MAKFWITIALLFSLIAQSAMVNAMPTSAMNDSHDTPSMQMVDGKMKCTMPDCPSDECMLHCQDSLTNHCKTHCLAQLYLSTSQPQIALMNHASKRIAVQSWAIQTADLGLTTPPPNSNLL
ncbi:hypothetical protein N7V09_03425 [Shewanella seohaensis]|uniref:hypothetical protein n=1 Tax=Shewanella seohaensis TaxID=755175 RepID=UPI00200F0DD3|nr:hypothetical protein [Shewanella seohaensis]MCL1120861.1 hypothetical protein [Shewanella seohaensis]UXM82675.1 hypothetical protein N7V09_03425 [Shewanella seohaensis]